MALDPELGLVTTHCTETNMEKTANSSTSTKVPPRSSSTGPIPGETKAKTGEPSAHMWIPASMLAAAGLRGPVARLVYQADVAVKTFGVKREAELMLAHLCHFTQKGFVFSVTMYHQLFKLRNNNVYHYKHIQESQKCDLKDQRRCF